MIYRRHFDKRRYFKQKRKSRKIGNLHQNHDNIERMIEPESISNAEVYRLPNEDLQKDEQGDTCKKKAPNLPWGDLAASEYVLKPGQRGDFFHT